MQFGNTDVGVLLCHNFLNLLHFLLGDEQGLVENVGLNDLELDVVKGLIVRLGGLIDSYLKLWTVNDFVVQILVPF